MKSHLIHKGNKNPVPFQETKSKTLTLGISIKKNEIVLATNKLDWIANSISFVSPEVPPSFLLFSSFLQSSFFPHPPSLSILPFIGNVPLLCYVQPYRRLLTLSLQEFIEVWCSLSSNGEYVWYLRYIVDFYLVTLSCHSSVQLWFQTLFNSCAF